MTENIKLEMPKVLEDCMRLRGKDNVCEMCAFQPKKLGRWTQCAKRIAIKYPDGVPASW